VSASYRPVYGGRKFLPVADVAEPTARCSMGCGRSCASRRRRVRDRGGRARVGAHATAPPLARTPIHQAEAVTEGEGSFDPASDDAVRETILVADSAVCATISLAASPDPRMTLETALVTDSRPSTASWDSLSMRWSVSRTTLNEDWLIPSIQFTPPPRALNEDWLIPSIQSTPAYVARNSSSRIVWATPRGIPIAFSVRFAPDETIVVNTPTSFFFASSVILISFRIASNC